MTTNHRSRQAHALVDAYLSDLDRALASAEPREKADTLAAVQDHIEEALAGRADDPQAVSQVLSALGPVESIANTATPVDAMVGASGSEVTGARSALVCSIISLALVFFAPIIAPIFAVAALVSALIFLRRNPQQRGMLHASILASSVTIVIVAIMGFLLISAGSDTITPEPVETVLPTDG